MHFEKLNYSFANETTDIELSILPENSDSVFCIAGSGARFTPLLSKNPIKIDVYDSSLAQLYLAQIRYLSIQQLDYVNYLKILGYLPAQPSERRHIFQTLKLPIENKLFWLQENTNWQNRGFIFIGRWEKKLQLLRKAFFLFHLTNLKTVFSKNTHFGFPEKAWALFCRIVLTEPIVKKLLYSGQSKYNLQQPFGRFIQQQFLHQLLKNELDQEFFLQFLFCGDLLSNKAWPIEANETIFNACKKSKTKVHFVHKNINEIEQFNYDFYSLSDCFSYLSDEASQNVMNQICNSSVKSAGVIRYFMYHPKIDFSQCSYLEQITTNTERVPIYKIMHYTT